MGMTEQQQQQQQPPNRRPLRIAQLGAGIFATNSHAPVIRKHPEAFHCVAVWATRQSSAETLALEYPDAKAYSGDPGWKHILQIPDLDAVVMALPFDVQPKYIFAALEAGKHVLSEKAIETTVQKAWALVERYRSEFAPHKLQWSIAENFRYEAAILQTADTVKHDIGTPFLATLNIRSPCTPDNPYLNTPWRKEPSWYGGFFIDAFVHAAAMLRLVLGEAKQVAATTSCRAVDHFIPAPDTMTARVEYHSGVQGTVAVTYACSDLKFELEVTGTEGTVVLQRTIDRPGYRLIVRNSSSANIETREFGFNGIEAEFLAFEAACRGRGDCNNTPQEATRDLAFVEACLTSGQNNGAITQVPTL